MHPTEPVFVSFAVNQMDNYKGLVFYAFTELCSFEKKTHYVKMYTNLNKRDHDEYFEI